MKVTQVPISEITNARKFQKGKFDKYIESVAFDDVGCIKLEFSEEDGYSRNTSPASQISKRVVSLGLSASVGVTRRGSATYIYNKMELESAQNES